MIVAALAEADGKSVGSHEDIIELSTLIVFSGSCQMFCTDILASWFTLGRSHLFTTPVTVLFSLFSLFFSQTFLTERN